MFKTKCSCGFDNSIGYCPLPDKKTSKTYTSYMKYIMGNSTNLHTIDRDNPRALIESGASTSSTLEVGLQAKLEFDMWPETRSQQVKECLQQVLPWSYN